MSVQSEIAYSYNKSLKDALRKRLMMNEVRMIDAEIYWDMDTMFGDTSRFRVPAGIEIKFIEETLHHKKCKKSEATLLVIIGERDESGCWIIGKCKNIWLKPKNEDSHIG